MLNEYDNKLHIAAVTCSANLFRNEKNLIKILIQVERRRIYKRFNRRNLLEYITKDLKIDSTYKFELNRVTLKALEIPVLGKALVEGSLRVGHARRIISKLTCENAEYWVEFAKSHTFKEVREHVARSNLESVTRETKKRLSGTQTRISFVANDSLVEKLERVQALLAQRGKKGKTVDAIAEMCDLFLKREDPVEKAKRSQVRRNKVVTFRAKEDTVQAQVHTFGIPTEPTPFANVHTSKRVPLTAAEKHVVMLRSGGRCTFTDHEGRCTAQRHTAIHHILPVSEGGSNNPENLTLVCSHHHDWIHQMSAPGMEMPWTFSNQSEASSYLKTTSH